MHERIKQVRIEAGLSQRDFGARIGVSRDTVASIESNRIEIKDVFVKAICREFQVRESWLRTGEGDEREEDVNAELDALCARYSLGGRARALIKTFAELGEDEQDVILGYVEKVAEAIREVPAADPIDPTPERMDEIKSQLADEKKARGESSVSSRDGQTGEDLDNNVAG